MFSTREKEIIKVLGNKKMSIEEITNKVFEGKDKKPFDAKISIGNTIRRIAEKCDFFELDWTLIREKQEDSTKYIIYKEKR